GLLSTSGDPAVLAGGLVALASLLPHGTRARLLDAAADLAAAAWAPAAGGAAAGWNPPSWADRPLFDRRDPRGWGALHQAAAALATDQDVEAESLAAWWELGAGAGVDADRLKGCCRELSQLSTAGDDAPLRLITWGAYDPDARPTDAVHDETPAHFVAAARAQYRMGSPAAAERTLDERRQEALEARGEDATIPAADEALGSLAVRVRAAAHP